MVGRIRAIGGLAVALVAFVVGIPTVRSQATNPNEIDVKPQRTNLDADDLNGPDSKVWALDFKFKPPRLIKVNVPGRGQKLCWYLWYQVVNKTGKPRIFIPDFELKTNDTNLVYRDEILPAVEEAIRAIEDPTGYQNIKNSVTISAEPIPPARPEAAVRPVTGVAIWMDPNEPTPLDDEKTKAEKAKMPKLADTNAFTIFVAGLSNGWAVTDPIPPETNPVVRRKTLQLNFQRIGDNLTLRSEQIKFLPQPQWIYRASPLNLPMLPGKKKD
jgi:hypothetical protein